jgi:hypothetical protein
MIDALILNGLADLPCSRNAELQSLDAGTLAVGKDSVIGEELTLEEAVVCRPRVEESGGTSSSEGLERDEADSLVCVVYAPGSPAGELSPASDGARLSESLSDSPSESSAISYNDVLDVVDPSISKEVRENPPKEETPCGSSYKPTSISAIASTMLSQSINAARDAITSSPTKRMFCAPLLS